MTFVPSAESARILIVAPFGRDAESVADLLMRAGYAAEPMATLAAAILAFDASCGVIVVTEEAIPSSDGSLTEALSCQPPWSDIPFVLLASRSTGRSSEAARQRLPEVVTNVIILERPMGSVSLISAISSALRSRQKQLQIRDQLAEIAEGAERLQLATAAADIGIWDYNPVTGELKWDNRCRAMFGMPVGAEVTYDGAFLAGLHPADRERVSAAVTSALRPGSDGRYDIEYRTLGLADGIERWLVAKGGGVFEHGVATRFVGTVIDVTDRKQLAARLNRSEDRLKIAMAAGRQGAWELDLSTQTLFASEHCKANFGRGPSDPFDYVDLFHSVNPEDQERMQEAVAKAIGTRSNYDIEYRCVHPDGICGWVHVRGMAEYDDAGKPLRMVGVSSDITQRKQNELELTKLNNELETRVEERSRDLLAAQEALRQSQKMEVVGQLTGGIAHDFNNMLTGVISALDIMQLRINAGRTADLGPLMNAATQSALRAANLTARLLAFSRRQSLDARPIDTNDLLASLEDLIRRTLSEQIILQFHLADTLPAAMVDANQLESAIVNLVVNARDAMPDGGVLTLETSLRELDASYVAAHPDLMAAGTYIVVAVSDTGVGMPPDVVAKAYEPFFTTKPLGQGTGLGLSMVYGFAKQSGGQVRIHSKPGHGTSVKIFLPVAASLAEVSPSRAAAITQGAGQTILVVEDDASVRLLVQDVLRELNYDALEAAEPQAALAVLRSDQPIELMISDVGLPGMNGRQLAEEARALRPELPILFMTGYAENAAIRAGFLGTNMSMITKPFALDALAEKVSKIIGECVASN